MRVNVSCNMVLTYVVSCVVALAMSPVWLQARPYAMAALGAQSQAATAPEQPQPAQLTPEQLQELVAPIALYPDALVAQILAASAYPTQIVEARALPSAKSESAGPGAGGRSQPAGLGSQRQGSDAIPFRACEYGQGPFVDVRAGGRECQSATGRNGRHPVHAPEGGAGRKSEKHAAGDRDEPGRHGHYSTGESAGRLRAGI